MEKTIEQKAKAYDEAIEKAKGVIEQNPLMEYLKKGIEYIFPELAESEDERIKTFLHHTFTVQYLCKDKLGKWHGEPVVNILSWLKKQGEKKLVEKIEPKFKVGDWIVENEPNNYARFIQILEVVNAYGKERYKISRDLHNDEDVVEYRFIENNYHSFTIQDAKDGDVLADDRAILLFRSIGNRNWKNVISYYAILETNLNNRFSISDGEEYWGEVEDCELNPATKEQRDLLFQKMHEAGYEWNDGKKELKKIEQKPWSEEDELCLTETLYLIRNSYSVDDKVERLSNWLKSLKDRVQPQPQQQWSEEDEDIKDSIIHQLKMLRGDRNVTEGNKKEIEWLKSLRPQSQWKPSDEQLDSLYDVLNPCDGLNREVLESLYQDLKKL